MSSKTHAVLTLLIGLVAMIVPLEGAEAGDITYFIQLVRGTSDGVPPSTDSRPIGPKIANTFRPVFKWSHYWEMSRQEVTLARGKKIRIQLAPERSVEIDLTDPAHRKVTAFEGKKPVSTVVDPVGGAMSIIGGDRTGSGSWFIVVRRDMPTT